MKKDFLILILLAFIFISATTLTEHVISTPAVPRIVAHEYFNNVEHLDKAVTGYIRQGFVNIRVTAIPETTPGKGVETWYVIAEKY